MSLSETEKQTSRVIRLEDVKENILKFKETGDSEYFIKILKQLDRLIMYMIFKVKKQYTSFQYSEVQDMYQLSITTMFKIIQKFKETDDATKIPAMVSSYVRYIIRKDFSYRNREYRNISLIDLQEDQEVCMDPEQEKSCFDVDWKEIVAVCGLTEKESELLLKSIVYEYTIAELSAEYRASAMKIRWVIVKGMNKIKEHAKELWG